MEPQFWIRAWKEGRTGFHRRAVHDRLMRYFPRLNPQPGQKVLVPLCGKSKDLLWLAGLDLKVHGVELHEGAVEAFFAENGLSPVGKTAEGAFNRYTSGNIAVNCGDFFGLGADGSYDFVYDRAALVALPAPMRKRYAGVVTDALKTGGKCLLIVYQYDQTKMEGPPFSVEDREIRELYGDRFTIELLESEPPTEDGPGFAAIPGMKQTVYVLTKTR